MYGVVINGEYNDLCGTMTDISLGGARIRCERAFPAGETLRLRRPSRISHDVAYEACWSRTLDEDGRYDTGLRFVGSMADFWRTWAASILAGFALTHQQIIERRATIRVSTELRALLENDCDDYRGVILNIGPGGALLSCPQPFDLETEFVLGIPDPVVVVDLPCRVLRTWKREMGWLLGVEFVELDCEQRDGVTRLIHTLVEGR